MIGKWIKRKVQKVVRDEMKAALEDPSIIDEEPTDEEPNGVLLSDMTASEYEEYKLMEEQGWKSFYQRLKKKIYGPPSEIE